jgi:HEPN domain-containing protein
MSYEFYTGISEYAKAGRHRMEDARALFEASRWRGAMYMAGYSVECLLKTKLMLIYGCRNLHELEEELQHRGAINHHTTVFTHHLELLLRLAQGFERLRQNRILWPQFNIVNRWIPGWRYTANLSNCEDAEDFLDAVDNMTRWIENSL